MSIFQITKKVYKMATEANIQELVAAVQTCLADKIQAGYDASSQLSVDIAHELAAIIEAKAANYTDVEIEKVMSLIGGDVDLAPFTEFMNTVKSLLDGDESTEEYDVFNLLVTDTAANKATLINQGSAITLITQTLTNIQTTLTGLQESITDHEARITTLEEMDHGTTDCESCQDDMLDLVKSAIQTGCEASTAEITAYQTARRTATTTAFADAIDPIFVNATGAVDTNVFTFTGTVSGVRPASVTVTTPNSVVVSATLVDGGFTVDYAPGVAPEEGDYTVVALDAANKIVGAGAVINHTNGGDAPEGEGDAPEGDGGAPEGDGAVL